MAPTADLYQVLGVARTATAEEIKKAYRRLARRYHPDVNPGKPEAEKRFREIQEAYAVLSDAEQRARYDRHGTVDEAEVAARQARARWGGGPRPGAPGGFEFRGFGGEVDLGDLFGEMFQGFSGRRAGRAAAPPVTPVTEAQVELDLKDAVAGTTVVVPVRREQTCAECAGRRVVNGAACARCHGAGILVSTERIRVRIPAGVGDGDRVRASHRGDGEVSVAVRVRPHPFFVRKGDDIHSTVPITFPEAYVGAEIEIGTVHGPVRARIPPGTQSGQRFRLRGKGVRNVRTGAPGDHLYTVQLTVPRVVSPAGREAARRVGELYSGDPRAGLPLDLE